LVAAATVLVVVQAVPASAVTYREWDTAATSFYDMFNKPTNSDCVESWSDPPPGITAAVCFVPHGDYFYVKDLLADGKSAVAYWVLQDGTRTGACRNSRGANRWGRCNKSFSESSKLTLRAGTYDANTKIIKEGPGPTAYCFASTFPGCTSFDVYMTRK